MNIIKKIVVLNMLMLVVVQVIGTTVFNASEIMNYTSEVSEVSSITKDSDNDSTESDINSEANSETNSEIASEEKSDIDSSNEESEVKKDKKNESADSNDDNVKTADKSNDISTYTLTESDITNSLFKGNISFKKTANSGLYTVTMGGVNEIGPDSIQGGETITMSLVDPADAPGTCTNPDVTPVITPNEEHTKPFENTFTGDLLADYSADGTSITFTFNDANLGFLLNLGQAVFAWDVDIDDSFRGIDFPCGINTVVRDTDGTELLNDTQEVVFNEPVASLNYVPVDWSLNDNYAKRGNIISPGSSVTNRQDLNSDGYYEGLGYEEPKGGIIENGAHYVGNAITLNITKGAYSRLSDVTEMRATFTLPQETTLMEDTVHVTARPYDLSTGNIEVTSELHPNFLTYDDSTKTATFTMTAEDFANIESTYGIDMSDPTITIYFEEKISKYTVRPQVDNYIYGSASTFDDDEWATDVDALDGYPNEGRVQVEYVDYDDSVVDASTRLAYQELADSSGVVRDPLDPTLNGTVTDENEIDVEANKNSTCNPYQVYNFNYQLYNNYVFDQTMGEITITLPDEVSFSIDDVVIELNDVEVAHDNEYFTTTQDGNNIIITGTEYSEDNIFEMDYAVINVSIPVTLIDISVGDTLTAISNWELFGETYTSNDIVTSIFNCDVIDPSQADTVISKSLTDASEDNLVQAGEVLTYTLEVTNEDTINANGVVVRDSMLENMPTWLTFNDDVTIDPSDIDYSGDLVDGDLTFNVIEPGETVTITYSVTAGQPLPTDVTEVSNIATDNGEDPTTVDPEICAEQPEDCAEVIIPLDPEEVIVDPGKGETVITKSMTDASGDDLVQGGEVLNYTLEVSNPNEYDAYNVVVRDSMLENMPEWLTFNDDVAIDPSDIVSSGSLLDGDLTFPIIKSGETVTITYSVTASQPLPTDVTEVSNIATDNGEDPTTIDPEICTEKPEDCAEVITPLDPEVPIIDPTNAETTIVKSVNDENGDGLLEGGEVLTYTLELSNPESVDAHNVVVRDSMLENMPTWLTFNDDVTIDPSDIEYSGNLVDGDLTFATIKAGETVKITYSVTAATELPEDLTDVNNVATDNGEDPTTIDPGICPPADEDCSAVVVPVEGETIIEKSVTDASGDGILQSGEVLTYTLNVKNTGVNDAHEVEVRDSMLENTPEWLIFNDDVTIDPSDIAYSGKLTNGNLVFDVIEAGQTVTITYSMTATHPLTTEAGNAVNLATDNGQDPSIIDPEVCIDQPEDCAITITPIDPEVPVIDPTEGNTVIQKSVIDEDGNGILSNGETLTYSLEIANSSEYDAHNVVVRDSMLESTPEWLTFNDDVTIDPSDIEYSGSLTDGDLAFDVIKAGETVTITYSLTADEELPTDITSVTNIATDDGQDPTDPAIELPNVCLNDEDDCDEVTVPLEGDTTISKSLVDENENGILEAGETVSYKLEVVNYTDQPALDVVVRDSMLENVPSELTFNNDVVINPSDIEYAGSLEAGNLTFASIEAGETVTITYSLTAGNELPSESTEFVNIATDNGEDPTTVDPEVCEENGDDCATASIITDKETEEVAKEDPEDNYLAITGGESMMLLFDLMAIIVVTLSLKFRLNK